MSGSTVQPANLVSGWPAPRYGPRNAAHNPDATPPRSEPEVEWSAGVPGVDSLVVSEELAFVAGDKSESTNSGIAAIEVTDGTVRWEQAAPGGSLCAINDTLYIGADGGTAPDTPDVRAVETSTGQQVWSFKTEATSDVYHLLAGSKTLYVGRLGYVDALARKDGELRWRQSVGNQGWTGTALQEGELYFAGGGETVRVEPNSGLDALWSEELRERWTTISGPDFPSLPVVTDKQVLIGGLNPTEPQRVVAYDRASGEIDWSTSPLGDRVQRPAVRGNLGYSRTPNFGGADPEGGLLAFELSSGESVWQRSLSAPTVPPIAAGDVVVAGTEEGVVRGFDADDGTPLWVIELESEVRTLAAAGASVFVGTQNGLLLTIR